MGGKIPFVRCGILPQFISFRGRGMVCRMRIPVVQKALLLVSLALISEVAHACDLCALYTAMQVESPSKGAFRLSASEQYTLLNRLQNDGHHVDNTENQYIKSSLTQLSGQYDLSDSTAFQVIAPVISRSWRGVDNGMPTPGSAAGFGDTTLLVHYMPIRYSDGDTTVRFRTFGGLKLPTGDAHLLGEEASPGHADEHGDGHDDGHNEGGNDGHGDGHGDQHGESAVKHAGEPHGPGTDLSAENAVHGHDVTLGSGSFDYPLGLGLTTQWKRFTAAADLQYTIRDTGSFSYRYANDLIWSTALGGFLYLEDSAQLAARVRFSGQYKGTDTGKDGVEFNDTAVNAKFIGPELSGTIGQTWQGVLGLDLPVDVNNSDLQLTATYRWRAALTYRF